MRLRRSVSLRATPWGRYGASTARLSRRSGPEAPSAMSACSRPPSSMAILRPRSWPEPRDRPRRGHRAPGNLLLRGGGSRALLGCDRRSPQRTLESVRLGDGEAHPDGEPTASCLRCALRWNDSRPRSADGHDLGPARDAAWNLAPARSGRSRPGRNARFRRRRPGHAPPRRRRRFRHGPTGYGWVELSLDAGDLDGNGVPDFAAASRYGLFYFEGPLFELLIDGFESGDTLGWSATLP